MRRAVGVSVEPDHLRAVGVRGARVLWGVHAPLDNQSSLAESLNAFLDTLPVGRFLRPRITAALGATYAQTKRLAGLPPLADEHLLARTVSEHAARFFLKNGVPLVTTSVRVDAEGRPWAAALQKSAVDAVVAACRANRLPLAGIVPAADVLRHEPRALAPLGDESQLFAAAYGAAVKSDALTWRAQTASRPEAPRWRIVTGAGAATFALSLAVLTPWLSAHFVERRAIAHLATIARPSRAAQRVSHDVALVTEALGEVDAFDRARRPMTVLMSQLAHALPDGAALLSLHADSAGGSIVAFAPRAGALLTRLENVPGVAAPEITGPVTRESAGGHDVERITIRFRWVRR